MSIASIRTAGLAAALMSLGAGFGTSAEVIHRPVGKFGEAYTPTAPRTRSGNNRPAGPTRAQKKLRRKIARASRRYNLRMGK